MNTIRARVSLLVAITFSILFTFGFLTYSSFSNYSHMQNELEISYSLVDEAFLLLLKAQTDEKKKEIEALANRVEPEFRSTALKNYLKNSTNDNLNFLLRTEGEYRKYVHPLIEYFEKRVTYFGAITLGSSILLAMALLFTVLRQIFNPLRDLSSKMVDFLNNRYSYKFSTPEPTEIGQLHSTFNNLAQKVLSQIDELKSLDKAKSEFLSIASHELRTPLTSIKGSLSLLNSGVTEALNESTKTLMTIALNETDRLIRLINEILDLAKIEARQFPLSCEWVSAKKMIDNTFLSLNGFCETAGVSLKAVGTEDLELFIDVDRAQQILTNLLSNSVKFSPKKSTVNVQFLIAENHEVRVEVSDRGPGIAPEDQAIIFEKFRQATSAKNPLVKGTGLGLAIAKALVEQHGGVIGVKSMPGEGSTFYFTLPTWRPLNQTKDVA